jgi:hypothetical protein
MAGAKSAAQQLTEFFNNIKLLPVKTQSHSAAGKILASALTNLFFPLNYILSNHHFLLTNKQIQG